MLGRLYAGLTGLAAPLLRLWLARRAARGREDPARLGERRGVDDTPRPPGRLLWLHAASVGEAVSVLPVLAALPADISVLFTTGTVTSARMLEMRLPELAGRVFHRFVPLDVPAWGARFLDHWRPDAAALVESEIWPNLIAGCAARGVPVALIGARMSARSLAGWQRVPGFARQVFGGLAWVQPQTDAIGQRLAALGAPVVGRSGQLKFAAAALPFDAAELARLRTLLGARPVWLAASTHKGEEAMAAAVHAALAPALPGLLTIIVPRHPERGAAIAAELGASRRGAGQDPEGGIWIADTLGELGLFYRLVGHAFMGRSLVRLGGQNPLEPARLGCAVAIGPHHANFAEAVAALQAAGGLTVVADAAGLAAWVTAMQDAAHRRTSGAAAQAAASSQSALPGEIAAHLAGLVRR